MLAVWLDRGEYVPRGGIERNTAMLAALADYIRPARAIAQRELLPVAAQVVAGGLEEAGRVPLGQPGGEAPQVPEVQPGRALTQACVLGQVDQEGPQRVIGRKNRVFG